MFDIQRKNYLGQYVLLSHNGQKLLLRDGLPTGA